MENILIDIFKYYVQFLSNLSALVMEIKESTDMPKSLLSLEGCVVIAFFIIAAIYSLLAIKIKGIMLGSILVVAVYSLLKHFKDQTNSYIIPLDNLIRDKLPDGVKSIFGAQEHYAIGFICVSIVIVIILAFMKNMIQMAMIFVSIFLGYKLYVRYLKEAVGCDNQKLEIAGVAIAVIILLYLFYWIFDLILVLFFALLGTTIFLVYTSVFFGKPADYVQSLEDVSNELLQDGTISGFKKHPDIVLFLVFPTLLFFMVQKGMFVK